MMHNSSRPLDRLALLFHSLRSKYRARRLGELNADKKIWIIRGNTSYSGFVARLSYTFERLIIARKRGLTPVVDMTNQPYLIDEQPANDCPNPWDHFFEQPCGVSLEDAMQSANVRFDVKYYAYESPSIGSVDMMLGNDGNEPDRAQLCAEQIRFNKTMREYLERSWDELGLAGNTLAVMSRGTDYRALRPKGHSIQPEPDELIARAHKIIDAEGIDMIYVNTEERFVRDMFEREFGSRLRWCESSYWDDYAPVKQDTPTDFNAEQSRFIGAHIESHTQKSKYQLNMEYIRNVWAASRCDHLLCGINSGTVGAILLNRGKYKTRDIVFKGYY